MYEDDDLFVSNRRRRRAFLYGSFLMSLLGAALGSAAFGTQFWYDADVSSLANVELQGKFHMGLFTGRSTLVGFASSVYIYRTVCSDDVCMFSCGSTKTDRENHLQQVLNGTLSSDTIAACISEEETALRQVFRRALPAGGGGGDQARSDHLRAAVHRSGKANDTAGGFPGDGGNQNAAASDSVDFGGAFNVLGKADSSAPVSAQLVAVAYGVELPGEDQGLPVARGQDANGVERSVLLFAEEEQELPGAWIQDASWDDVESDAGSSTTDGPPDTTPGSGGGPEISTTDGLMSHGLWGVTVACLALGLLFAVLGAVFAVVNTATTPVEAITGIPGLYIWNGLAALFELVAVICWSVQFSSHLTYNVLVVDSLEGWTTEGGEALGYSFWLVVVAIVVHIANCALIAFGTYEPKVKEKIQEPDKANNDILLY